MSTKVNQIPLSHLTTAQTVRDYLFILIGVWLLLSALLASTPHQMVIHQTIQIGDLIARQLGYLPSPLVIW